VSSFWNWFPFCTKKNSLDFDFLTCHINLNTNTTYNKELGSRYDFGFWDISRRLRECLTAWLHYFASDQT
jgi:hypothetical protein